MASHVYELITPNFRPEEALIFSASPWHVMQVVEYV